MNFTIAHGDYLDPDRHNTTVTKRRKPHPNKWVLFTKRTDDPKLAWLENALANAGIKSRRSGESWHAPVLEVKQRDLDAAWEILAPIDDIADDSPRWSQDTHGPEVVK
jgi:hypothetical protein